MQKIMRINIAFFLILALPFLIPGQNRSSNGSVSGSVSVDGKVGANITLMLVVNPVDWNNRKAVATTTTDNEGKFRFTGIVAGKYRVVPHAPVLVGAERERYETLNGKNVTLEENETVENIDFKLRRGGVITGRVTDNDGRPVIAQRITIESVDGKTQLGGMFGDDMFDTDDRGVYRIYGLPSGRYLVSLGVDKNDQSVAFGMSARIYFTKTFHPATNDKAEAKVIELDEGEEETGVDINLGKREKTFAFNGRVTETESNKPVANVWVAYGRVREAGGGGVGSYGYDTRSDASGQFTVSGVKPGRYSAFVVFEDKNDTRTSNAIPFEITDSDVNNLEIKISNGTSISGVAVLEGANDPTALAKFAEMSVSVSTWGGSTSTAPLYRTTKIASDGSFRFNGITPNKIRLYPAYPVLKNFTLLRVEHNGIVLKDDSIEVSQGTDITNVRMVFEYGVNVLRGQIKVEGGNLPEGARLFLLVNRLGQTDSDRFMEADARGQFVFEGLGTGEYEVTLTGQGLPKPVRIKQRVNVNSLETNITITLNLTESLEY